MLVESKIEYEVLSFLHESLGQDGVAYALSIGLWMPPICLYFWTGHCISGRV